MTLPRKGARSVTVDGQRYRWIASGNDGTIDVTIQVADGSGPMIHAYFTYAGVWKPRDSNSYSLDRQGRAVTPEVVRSTIRWALEHDWDPHAAGRPPLQIGVDQTSTIAPVIVHAEPGDRVL